MVAAEAPGGRLHAPPVREEGSGTGFQTAVTWWACEHPERPTDALVVWHYDDCIPCAIKAEALARQHPDDASVRWLIERMGIVETP